jgi:hypothetical protein
VRQRALSRALTGVVAGVVGAALVTVLLVLVPASAPASIPVASRPAPIALRMVCVEKHTKRLGAPSGSRCTHGTKKKALRTTKPLAACVKGTAVLGLAARACLRKHGKPVVIPAAAATRFCAAPQRHRLLRPLTGKACKRKEREYVVAALPAPGPTPAPGPASTQSPTQSPTESPSPSPTQSPTQPPNPADGTLVAGDVTLTGAFGNTEAVLGLTKPAVGSTLSGSRPGSTATDTNDLPVSVVPASVTTTLGGTMTIHADGSLDYRPPLGVHDTTDTAPYTVTDGTLEDTGTITLTIGALLWFVDAAASDTSTGASWAPYPSLGALNAVQQPSTVLMLSGRYGAATLATGETVIGQGLGYAGVLAPGTAPLIATATGTALTLAGDSSVSGLTISATGSALAVAASSITGATVAADVAGGGVSLTGSNVAFTGRLSLSTGGQPAFTATGGGTVTATGAGSTLTTTTGAPLTVTGTTIGADGLHFDAISSASAAYGIALSDTGAVGALTVAGPGSAGCGGSTDGTGAVTAPADATACHGGEIATSTGAAIRLTNTRAPSLTGLWVHGGTAAALTVQGVTDGAVQNSLVESDAGVVVTDGTGTFGISGSTVRSSTGVAVTATRGGGSGGLQITGSQVTGAADDGVRVSTAAGSESLSVTTSHLGDNAGDQIQVSSTGGTTTASLAGNDLVSTAPAEGGIVVNAAAASWTGQVSYDIGGNRVAGTTGPAIAVSETNATSVAQFGGDVENNLIGTAAAGSCSSTGSGIVIDNEGGAGTLATAIVSNTLQHCAADGIALTAGDGGATLRADVTSNSYVGDPSSTYTLWANLGLGSGDTGTSCLNVADNDLPGPVLRLWHRYGVLEIPGLTGSTASDVSSLLTASNTLSGATVDPPVTGTFAGIATTCTQSS